MVDADEDVVIRIVDADEVELARIVDEDTFAWRMDEDTFARIVEAKEDTLDRLLDRNAEALEELERLPEVVTVNCCVDVLVMMMFVLDDPGDAAVLELALTLDDVLRGALRVDETLEEELDEATTTKSMTLK